MEASDAWARSTPAVADTAAVYLTLTNDSENEQSIVGATSDRCGSMEIHETTIDGGVMEMDRLGELVIPAGETVHLEPGGLHLMCLGVEEPLVADDSFVVDLEMRTDRLLRLDVKVEDR